MKKLLLAFVAATVVGGASAANFASVEVDRVKDDRTGAVSQAQYVRVGVDVGAYNLGLQSRTAVFEKGGMLNSAEGTVGRNFGPVNVFGGLGFDNGFNGAKGGSFQYGLVGAATGMPLGPVFGFAGVKTRLNWQKGTPDQTVAFGGLSYNVTKGVSVELDVSKSKQDIRETAYGLGVRVGF